MTTTSNERQLKVLPFRPYKLRPHLLARTAPDIAASIIARRDLARYYNALGDTLGELRAVFSEVDLAYLLDATTGITYGERDYNGIIEDLRRYIARGRTRWGTALNDDEKTIQAKVEALAPFARLALVDALERAHITPDSDVLAPTPVVSLPTHAERE